MILDSLGELHMLRGDLDQAKDYLRRAVALATENGNKWYAAQALRTLGRCYLAIEDPAKALAKAKEALTLAESIGDRQAICESRLIAAEAHLLTQRTRRMCTANFNASRLTLLTRPQISALPAKRTDFTECWQWLRSDAAAAAQHFGSSVSIFDMLGDRYRAARAHLRTWTGLCDDQFPIARANISREH